ncbi:MAG: ABC transporter substrate-binding protein [Archaeoglobaceae archaeon]|nr:ABC transporter substrate-binding protein [Archaeoglobaceae archaeon]
MRRLFILILIAALFLTCCIQGQEKKEMKELKVGILPIEDSLPIVVAKNEGIFEKYGLNVKIITFQSALERDTALTAKEIDATIADPIAVILLNNAGYKIKIVSLCLGKNPEEGVFAILASPNSSINSIEDLNGKTIAISSNTIIEYVTDKLLSYYKVKANKIEVKQIPLRLQMLLDNKIDAATLPEPLASFAVYRGAKLIVSDAMLNESISQTVIVFRENYIEENEDAVKNFIKAYNDAVSIINSNPEKYKDLFVEIARVPKPIAEHYAMPKYPNAEQFPKKFYDECLEWAKNKGLVEKEIDYDKIVYKVT